MSIGRRVGPSFGGDVFSVAMRVRAGVVLAGRVGGVRATVVRRTVVVVVAVVPRVVRMGKVNCVRAPLVRRGLLVRRGGRVVSMGRRVGPSFGEDGFSVALRVRAGVVLAGRVGGVRATVLRRPVVRVGKINCVRALLGRPSLLVR